MEATHVLSGNYLQHPLGVVLQSYGTAGVPWVLEYMQESREAEEAGGSALSFGAALELLMRIAPPETLPSIPPEKHGRFTAISDFFDDWGVEQGHLPPREVR